MCRAWALTCDIDTLEKMMIREGKERAYANELLALIGCGPILGDGVTEKIGWAGYLTHALMVIRLAALTVDQRAECARKVLEGVE